MELTESVDSLTITPQTKALNVFYCSICSFPPEYCEYGKNTFEKCKKELKRTNPELFQELYGVIESAKDEDGEGEVNQEQNLVKKVGKVDKGKPAKTHGKVTIKKTARNKRKCITSVYGLDLFGVDLKKTAKTFAGKFACGSSVAQNAQGHDEIVIQGDVSQQVSEIIQSTFNISASNIVILEEKKAKKEDE
jgi:density-regulated protein DRP1